MSDNDERNYFLQEREFDAKRYISVFFRKRWMLFSIMSIVMVITVIHTFRQTPTYRATATILIETPTGSLSISETQKASVVPQIGSKDYYSTQYAILSSEMLSKRVCQGLKLSFPPSVLREMISVDPVRNTRLVNVSVYYQDPAMAAKIANTLVGVYIEQNIESMLFMSKEILKAFPAEMEEIEKHTIYGRLKELSNKDALESLPPIAHDLLLQSLKTEKVRVETELATLSKTYKERHPKVANLKAELNFIENKIDIETDRILRSVKEDLAGRLQANNIRVIDYAETPKNPIRPKKLKNVLYGLLFSVFLGMGIILFTEYLDDTIKNQEDVEGKLNMPYLGYFPEIKNDANFASPPHKFNLIDKNMEFSTSIRNVRTNILFSAPSDKLKTILITSTLPQEGKSFFSSYLAYTLAKTGSKTLLVDGDIRKSKIHGLFGLNRVPGITNLMVEDLNPDNVIRKTDYENLYILTAGSSTPNPLELLGSDKMKRLLENLSSKFEKIIIDSPPSLMLSDSLVLSKISDATVLVTKSGTIAKDAFYRVRDKFKVSNSKVLGVVINFFHIERHSYYYKDKYYHKYYKSYYSSDENGADQAKEEAKV